MLSCGDMSGYDAVDRALLAALAPDPRATVVALADRLGLSRNTVQARMARLEASGAFLSFVAILTATSVSAGVRVLRAKTRTAVHRHPWDLGLPALLAASIALTVGNRRVLPAVVTRAVTPGPAPVAKAAVVTAAVTPGRRRRRI